MPELSVGAVSCLLRPYFDIEPSEEICGKVQRYVSLLERWNAKLNLTAVRDPEQMVGRHFGESFFLARHLPQFSSLLDVGSGAGFPGLPISLLHPDAQVVLAESQSKKAAFLREAAEAVGSQARVWGHRVEQMPPHESFNVVVLRAVDNMQAALQAGAQRLKPGGTLGFFATQQMIAMLPDADWLSCSRHKIPLSEGVIVIASLHAFPEFYS